LSPINSNLNPGNNEFNDPDRVVHVDEDALSA
jgi:hypothetical protein